MSVFHDGELAVQHRAGVVDRASKVGRGIHPSIPDAASAFLAQREELILGGVDQDGRAWATVVTGEPGFLSASPHRLDVSNPLEPVDPLHPLRLEQQVGTLGIDLATRRRARVNGRVLGIDAEGWSLSVEQAYANCPKYIQRRADLAAEDGVGSSLPGGTPESVVGGSLSAAQKIWIEEADTFFLATVHGDGGADASHRGGRPGFIQVDSPTRIAWPDYSGNAMFNSLGNIESDGRAGILVPDYEGRRGLQLSGTAEIIWEPRRAVEFPGAERVIQMEIERVVERRELFPKGKELLDSSPFNP